LSRESIRSRCSTAAKPVAYVAPRRRVGRDELGVLALQRAELTHQRVVLPVGDRRAVEHVVAVVVLLELLGELGVTLQRVRGDAGDLLAHVRTVPLSTDIGGPPAGVTSG
jgi:hypothetical protein